MILLIPCLSILLHTIYKKYFRWLKDLKVQNRERTKMVVKVDTLHLLAQPELTENPTARKSNTK